MKKVSYVLLPHNVTILEMSSGCGIEKLQLETAKSLEMALATYSIVAWRLLYLTHLARSDTDVSCEIMLEPPEWQALYATIHHKKRL